MKSTSGMTISFNNIRHLALTLVLGISFSGKIYAQETKKSDPGVPAVTQIFADSLLPAEGRASGMELKDAPLKEGGTKWFAAKGVTLGEAGAVTATPNGAHHLIRPVAGIIHVEADINATGSGFSGLALGKGDLSGNFWANLSMIFYINGDGGFNLMVGSKNLITNGDKSLIRAGVPNHLDLSIDTMARTATAKVNGTVVLNAVPLPEDAKLSGINALGFRFNEPLKSGLASVKNYRAEVTSKASAGLEPVDLGMVYVAPNQEATLQWKVASPGPSNSAPYIIRDYIGGEFARGTAVLKEGQATVSKVFPRGYFEIVFPEANQSFGIVSIEPYTGPTDPFFCMDAGLSWLERNPATRTALVRMMARSGIAMVRERLGMGAINPAKGKYTWEGGGMNADTLRKQYEENHIKILENLDGGGGPYLGKPKNLSEVAAAIVDLNKHWTVWGGIEGGNEPDLRPEPADQYIPLVKVMSYALAQTQSKIPVVAGALATMPPGPYFETCVANGMLDDSDAITIHSYDRAPDIEAMVVRYRTWLKGAGKEALPIWHGECGWAWKHGPERPPIDQDATSALHITAKALESKVCGLARHFPFILTYYDEGIKNFAMMGKEVTPLRSLAAYSAGIAFVSNKNYLGDFVGLDASVKLARVFEGSNKDECLAVLYTGSVVPGAVLDFPFKINGVAGADGRKLELKDGKLPIADGLIYVWMNRTELGGKLKTDTTAMQLFTMGRNPLQQTRRASPILIQYLASETPARSSARRYLISRKAAEALPIRVRVFNLSANEIVFAPSLNVPGKSPIEEAKQAIPGMGFKDYSWTVDASQGLDIAKTHFISVSGKAENAIQPTPVAMPFVMEGGLEEHLKKHAIKTSLPIADLAKWSQSNSGGTSKFSSPAEGTWRMDVTFPESATSWTYPKFSLPTELDLKSYSGLLIRGKITNPAKNVAVIAGSGQGIPSFWVPDLFSADGEWHVVYVPFAEFKPGPGGAGNQNTRLAPELWKTLQIGFGNTKGNAIEVSHFMLVGGSGD